MIRGCSEGFVFYPAHSCLNCSPIDFTYQKPIIIFSYCISPTCRADMLCFGVYVKMYSHNVISFPFCPAKIRQLFHIGTICTLIDVKQL